MQINDAVILAELRHCHDVHEKALSGVPENSDREIRRLEIAAFGDSAGMVDLEFTRVVEGIERHGRETHFWFRFPEEGWRIASTHVSLFPLSAEADYVSAASARIGLKIAPEDFADVNENLSRIAEIAGFLTQFPLDRDVEAAPVFQP